MPTASLKDLISDERRTGLRIGAWLPIAVVAALLVVAMLAPGVQPGPFVPRVTVSNASAYSYDVEVAGAHPSDWTLLGIVAERGTTSIAEVYDQGSTWTFRFSVQGQVLGDVTEPRADLVASGWRITIPDQYALALKAAGVVPTAPSR